MAPGDPERPERPDYNVYRGGSGGRGRGRRAEQPQADAKASATPGGEGDGGDSKAGSGYTVYKARRRFSRPSGDAIEKVRDRFRRGGPGDGRLDPGEKPLWKRALKWAAIAVGAWLLLSLLLFVVSAQIQSSKLNDAAADQLGAFPLLVASGQTILVMGTDVRPEGVPDANGNPTAASCVEGASRGDPTPSGCLPSRADTLMLVRAGGGAFEKLSIPRDTFASIPGQGDDKINAAYAFGGAQLQVETIEDFLGIDVNHVVILDFEGFADFIDSLGGVQVALREPVKSLISGGASNGGVTLKLERGENELDGQQALALARTRENLKDPSEGDPERAQRQQLILAGIQDRLTSPTRIPYNFLHAPWIAWNAPKAMVSDMGGLTLPQLAIAAGIGGNSPTQILKPSGATDGGALVVDEAECRQAVEKFLGEPGPRQPACSPPG